MLVELKSSDQILRQMIVTVDKETYEKDFSKAQKSFSKEVEIKGFRKGKVPMDVVIKKYGNEIKSYYINEYSNEYFRFGVKEMNVVVLNQPTFVDANENENGENIFVYEFESYPEGFEYDLNNLQVKFKATEFSEGMLEKTVTEILQKNAEEVPLDADQTIDINDIVVLHTSNGDKTLPKLTVNVKELEIYGLEEDDLIGLRIDESFTVDNIDYKVLDAFHMVLPEQNDETAKLLGHDSLEAMITNIRENLIEDLDEQNKYRLNNAIIEAFAKQNKSNIKIPEELLIQAGHSMLQQYMGGNSPDFDKLPNDFVKSIGERQLPFILWDIVYEKIATDMDIKVDQEELDREIVKLANRYHTSAEDIVAKHPAIVTNIKNEVLSTKVLDYIRPSCTITEPDPTKNNEENNEIDDGDYEILEPVEP